MLMAKSVVLLTENAENIEHTENTGNKLHYSFGFLYSFAASRHTWAIEGNLC